MRKTDTLTMFMTVGRVVADSNRQSDIDQNTEGI